ncbi:MAG: restriction endonuclease, partial [Candidatus Stahlbacteria bacterium]|nr:restriction endonuclease [Candidatus Stahlbacteria bacterium]
RLKKAGAVKEEHYKTIGLPATEDDLRKLKPFEFQNWVMDEMGAIVSRRKVGDMGIDGCLEKTLYHDRAGIQVKQSDNVGRNVVDNFMSALKRAKYTEGYIIAFSFTKGSYEEVARLKNTGELEIKLVTVRELLDKRKIIKAGKPFPQM